MPDDTNKGGPAAGGRRGFAVTWDWSGVSASPREAARAALADMRRHPPVFLVTDEDGEQVMIDTDDESFDQV